MATTTLTKAEAHDRVMELAAKVTGLRARGDDKSDPRNYEVVMACYRRAVKALGDLS